MKIERMLMLLIIAGLSGCGNQFGESTSDSQLNRSNEVRVENAPKLEIQLKSRVLKITKPLMAWQLNDLSSVDPVHGSPNAATPDVIWADYQVPTYLPQGRIWEPTKGGRLQLSFEERSSDECENGAQNTVEYFLINDYTRLIEKSGLALNKDFFALTENVVYVIRVKYNNLARCKNFKHRFALLISKEAAKN